MKLRAPEYIILFLILLTTCSTYYLHWTHGPVPHDHEKYRFRKPHVHAGCSIEADCSRYSTCVSGKCVVFWPALRLNTTCQCLNDIINYEDHFYLKHVSSVQYHKGPTSNTCVVTYRWGSHNSTGSTVKEYEERNSGALLRRESTSGNSASLVALCKNIKPILSKAIQTEDKSVAETLATANHDAQNLNTPVEKNKDNADVVSEHKAMEIETLPSLRFVDPFIGTATTGHTTPGAKAPFGMMYMTPVNAYDPLGSKWWEYTAGYQYTDKMFSGIAHTALTGTGIPGLLDIKISPFEDSRQMNKDTEIAHPGYYSVNVDGVNVAVVAGNRFGIHRYVGTSQLFLKSPDCSVQPSNNILRGSCNSHFNEKWEHQTYPYTVYFYIELPHGSTYANRKITCPDVNIDMKIAISYVDERGAETNFKHENTDWHTLYKRTSTEWASTMDKIQIHGWRSDKQRRIFSSALYRTLLSPYTHNDADGRIRGPEQKIYKVDFTYYTFLSTWDIYRTWSSVIRLVRPDVLTDIAKTAVFHFKKIGIMPRWTVAGVDIGMMPGVPSINLAVQAWRWGLTDSKLTRDIYEAVVGTLESKGKYKEGHLDAFVEHQVVPCGGSYKEVVSQSLELGLNAYCAAELAAHLRDSKEKKWRALANTYQRHYDSQTTYLVGAKPPNFCIPSSMYAVDANPELYTEGNAITWLWSVPHDFKGLRKLLGKDVFTQRLHDLFTKDVGHVTKRDYSGLIGAYAHGNEPTHHVPFWFKLNGDEKSTNKYVHQILNTLYMDTPDGLPGNDDAGQISAWYVMATLGLYPVDPIAAEFQTHQPLVKHAVFNDRTGERHTLTPTTKKEHVVVKYTIPDSLKAYVTPHSKGGLFVKTGDIPEMWIRDSVAQVWPYRDSHPGMIAEVLYRQSEFILHDVYANSYNLNWQKTKQLNHHMQTLGRGEWVGTRNYELDSGCYFLRLLYHAWKNHHLDTHSFKETVSLLIETWQIEQYHEEQSPYRYPELKRDGLSSPVAWTGMTWTAFRPSDDRCEYGYLIPANLFAAVELEHVVEMFPDMQQATTLRNEIVAGVLKHGTWTDTDGKKCYCYEADGLGGCNKMDDANVPSLLSVPYLDPEKRYYDDKIWKNTYEWIWSSKNPYFFSGSAASGIGSPHTWKDYIWPMSLIIRGIVDPSVASNMKQTVKKTMIRGKIHESFHKNNPSRLTREDFSWPNELYKELLHPTAQKIAPEPVKTQVKTPEPDKKTKIWTCGWQMKPIYDYAFSEIKYGGIYAGQSDSEDILLYDWGPCSAPVEQFKGTIYWFDGENHNHFTSKIRPADVYFGGKDVSVKKVEWSFLATAAIGMNIVDKIIASERPEEIGQEFMLYVQSNCVSHRENAFDAIASINTPTAAGKCHGHGSKWSSLNIASSDWSSNVQHYNNYRFALVMENSVAPGYITEKIATAFVAGCIPIYYGHRETVEKWFNPEAFVFYEPSNPDEALKQIRYLEENRNALNEMRKKPITNNPRLWSSLRTKLNPWLST